MSNTLIFDEDYTGPRYTYGCTHRPPSIGCQPDGRIIGADRPQAQPNPRVLFGTISYPRELTSDEIYSYELLPIPALNVPPSAAVRAILDYTNIDENPILGDALEYAENAPDSHLHKLTSSSIPAAYLIAELDMLVALYGSDYPLTEILA